MHGPLNIKLLAYLLHLCNCLQNCNTKGEGHCKLKFQAYIQDWFECCVASVCVCTCVRMCVLRVCTRACVHMRMCIVCMYMHVCACVHAHTEKHIWVSCYSTLEHRASTKQCQQTSFLAMALTPYQVFPSISLFSILLQLLLGLPVLCGHHVNCGYLMFTKTVMLINFGNTQYQIPWKFVSSLLLLWIITCIADGQTDIANLIGSFANLPVISPSFTLPLPHCQYPNELDVGNKLCLWNFGACLYSFLLQKKKHTILNNVTP
jgi:hypothetical protein